MVYCNTARKKNYPCLTLNRGLSLLTMRITFLRRTTLLPRWRNLSTRREFLTFTINTPDTNNKDRYTYRSFIFKSILSEKICYFFYCGDRRFSQGFFG